MVNYVHFLLEGECRLIEHMIVYERSTSDGRVQHELYDPRISEPMERDIGLPIKRKSLKEDQVIQR